MSKDIMSFYVRLVLPDKQIILFQISDLNKSLGDYFERLLEELEDGGDDIEMINLLKNAFTSEKFSCWNKSCNLETKFITLISKVEKIDEKESDVFEIKL